MSSPFLYKNNQLHKIYKILKSSLTQRTSYTPGKLTAESKKLYVSTSDFDVEIHQIQQEGKKPMNAADFINGMNKSEKVNFS